MKAAAITPTSHQGKGDDEDGGGGIGVVALTPNVPEGALAVPLVVIVWAPGAEAGTTNVQTKAPFESVIPEQRVVVVFQITA